MKILISIIATMTFIAATPQNTKAQEISSPSEYLEALYTPFEDISSKTWGYLKAVTKGKSAKKIDKKRQKLINEVKEAQLVVRGVRGYQGDTDMKNAIRDYLKVNYLVLNEDYDKIMDLEEIAEQSYDAMEAYLLAQEKADATMNEAYEMVSAAQQAYAAANNINLITGEKDKRAKQIEHASDMIEHRNDLYLIFFKVFKEEAYVMEALAMEDVSAIEQHNNSMIAFVEEGLDQIDDIEPFLGDTRLKSATRTILNFYKKEAEKEIPGLVDFFVSKDDFDRIQKKLDRKKKKDRTQEDIDAYNNAANDFNKAANAYNQIINRVNKGRATSFNNYNKAMEDFFNRHN